IETDKATMEVEAVDEGKIGRLVVAEGTEGVKVNAVIAVLLEEGEDASALDQAGKKESKPEKTERRPEPEPEPQPEPQPERPSTEEPMAGSGKEGGMSQAEPIAAQV